MSKSLQDTSGINSDFLVTQNLFIGEGGQQINVAGHVNDLSKHIPSLEGVEDNKVLTAKGGLASWEVSTGGSGSSSEFQSPWGNPDEEIAKIKNRSVESWTLTSIKDFENQTGTNLIYGAASSLDRLTITGEKGIILSGKTAFTKIHQFSGSVSGIGVAFGKNGSGADFWIAITKTGYLTSTNGITFGSITALGSSELQSIFYGGGYFLIVAADGTIYRSTWVGSTLAFVQQETDKSLTQGIRKLTFMEEVWVGVGDYGKIVISEDANVWNYVQWLIQPSSATVWMDVCAGNGMFLAVGTSGQIAMATARGKWVLGLTSVASNLLSCCYKDSLYVIGGSEGALLTSNTLKQWTARNSATTANIRIVHAFNDLFWLFTDAGQIITSNSLNVTITPITYNVYNSGNESFEFLEAGEDSFFEAGPGNISPIHDGVYAFGKYILVGEKGIAYSTDKKTWTKYTSQPFTAPVVGIATGVNGLGNAIAIAIDTNNKYSMTTDGSTWGAAITIPGTLDFEDICYYNKTFHIATSNGPLFRSSFSGATLTWIQQPDSPNISDRINKIAGGSGLWIGVGNNGRCIVSDNAANFANVSSFTSEDLLCIGHGMGMFLIGASNGVLYTTTDGEVFTKSGNPFATSVAITGADYNPNYGIFILTNADGLIAISKDLVKWKIPLSPSTKRVKAIISGPDFIIGNEIGEVFYSRISHEELISTTGPFSNEDTTFFGRITQKNTNGTYAIQRIGYSGGAEFKEKIFTEVNLINATEGSLINSLVVASYQCGSYLAALFGSGSAPIMSPNILSLNLTPNGKQVTADFVVTGTDPVVTVDWGTNL